jgi:hypothetical protein
MSVHFDQIVPWGRTREEYELMFDLASARLSDGVLDCGGGPSSFTAELSADGCRAVSVDPIYNFSGPEIRTRFDAITDSMIAQVRATPDDWVWGYHGDPEGLLRSRRAALEKFLADYDSGLREGRYLAGELPVLPFAAGSFSLAVCSHLLFLYSDLIKETFHIQAVREMCRVAREVRIFPLLTLARQPSPHLSAVRSALEADGFATEVVLVNFEFQRGGNQMLRVSRK